MAKRKKGGFVARDFIVVTGIAAVAYFLFSSFKKGTTGNTTGGGTISPSGGTTTTGGGSLPPSGGTTTGCNLLVNGFVNAGYVPPNDATYSIAGEPVMRDLTVSELSAPLKMGQKGLHVMAFQIWLNAKMLKEDLIPVDGVFGNQTLTLLRKNIEKLNIPLLETLYNEGRLTLNNINLVSVNIKSQRRRFNAGFLPNCPQATNFYFGYVIDNVGTVFDLSSSVVNEY